LKYATVFLVLLFAWWIWRKNRRAAASPVVRAPNNDTSGGVMMLQCAHCGVHLLLQLGAQSQG
jgi:uncharacterized iron-regulated membrane protein